MRISVGIASREFAVGEKRAAIYVGDSGPRDNAPHEIGAIESFRSAAARARGPRDGRLSVGRIGARNEVLVATPRVIVDELSRGRGREWRRS